ncbi:hypothetical protein J7E52_02160 [Bacillus sp. ISL-34]|uniref:hypothetical protein n=1 Tax=Bacillus sp. ISL-34 TaxID=2819121 RepID=UPI001BE8DC4E|nr:hypothetical protein [Bacillus sp. ISL-34]MBT2645534.1 hypothetical protein [Bacillus sp. ISL-34]
MARNRCAAVCIPISFSDEENYSICRLAMRRREIEEFLSEGMQPFSKRMHISVTQSSVRPSKRTFFNAPSNHPNLINLNTFIIERVNHSVKQLTAP